MGFINTTTTDKLEFMKLWNHLVKIQAKDVKTKVEENVKIKGQETEIREDKVIQYYTLPSDREAKHNKGFGSIDTIDANANFETLDNHLNRTSLLGNSLDAEIRVTTVLNTLMKVSGVQRF